MDRPDVPRLWASSEDGQHVVQIQKNAFFSNWLKAGDVAYRHYRERRQEFSHQLGQLEEFFRERGIGQIQPTSWNVTYVNHIDYSGLEHVGSEAGKTLTAWTNRFSDMTFLREPDRLTLSFAFPMPDNAGRLNVILVPVVLPKDKRQVLRLDLTARGQLKATEMASALSAIDLGHEWVVRRVCLADPSRDAPSLGERTMSTTLMSSRQGAGRRRPWRTRPIRFASVQVTAD